MSENRKENEGDNQIAATRGDVALASGVISDDHNNNEKGHLNLSQRIESKVKRIRNQFESRVMKPNKKILGVIETGVIEDEKKANEITVPISNNDVSSSYSATRIEDISEFEENLSYAETSTLKDATIFEDTTTNENKDQKSNFDKFRFLCDITVKKMHCNEEDEENDVKSEDEKNKLSTIIARNINVVYNRLEERAVNIHQKTLDITGIDKTETYKKATKFILPAKEKVASLMSSAVSFVDTSTYGMIPVAFSKATDKLDDAYGAASTKYNNVQETIKGGLNYALNASEKTIFDAIF